MRIRRVTYDLGNVIERQEYLDGRYGAPGEKRAKKKKATPEEVEQVNQWTRERKARHRLRMYFKVNDYFFTLTYPKEERPPDMKIVTDGKRVWTDENSIDIVGHYLESGNDWKDIKAWMPIPKPYKKGGNND